MLKKIIKELSSDGATDGATNGATDGATDGADHDEETNSTETVESTKTAAVMNKSPGEGEDIALRNRDGERLTPNLCVEESGEN